MKGLRTAAVVLIMLASGFIVISMIQLLQGSNEQSENTGNVLGIIAGLIVGLLSALLFIGFKPPPKP